MSTSKLGTSLLLGEIGQTLRALNCNTQNSAFRRNFVSIVLPMKPEYNVQKIHIRTILLIFSVMLCTCTLVYSQTDSIVKGEAPITQIVKRYVIHSVKFEIQTDTTTDNLPSDADMLSTIASQPTDFGLTTRMIRSLAFESLRNKEAPTLLKNWLVGLYGASAKDKFKYFDRSVVANDILRINDLFLQRGFHDAQTRCVFTKSADERDNSLVFLIRSGRQYMIDTVVFNGLDSISADVRKEIAPIISTGVTPFNEAVISKQISNVFSALHDNGYAFAGMSIQRDTADTTTQKRFTTHTPDVYMDTVRKYDSVTVYVSPGKRYRIGSITFIDSTFGHPVVSGTTKIDQVELTRGNWYSKSLMDASTSNLMNLGTFDRVFIHENIVKRSVDDKVIETDTINLDIFTLYRRVWEVNYSAFYNSTFPDNFNNAGIEVSYLHRNAFGAAQNFSVVGRYTLRNTGNFFDNWISSGWTKAYNESDAEFELGASLFQPDITRWFRKRINLSVSGNPSLRAILGSFKLLIIPLRLNLTMPINDQFDRIQLDLLYEAQRPYNYSQTLDFATKFTDSLEKIIITQTLEQYRLLDSVSNNSIISTLALVSLSFNQDRTDNVFTPTTGYKLSMLGEYSFLNLTSFSRLQGMFTNYSALSNQTVLAFKARAGHILWRNTDDSYVPFERHYFAGGASSIRSYGSRTLYYRTQNDTVTTSVQGGLDNYIGYSSIIELSAELRYTLGYYSGLGDFVAGQVNRIGFAVFLDAGNVFNRLTKQKYNDASFSDMINPLNLAWGGGVGLRYATPIGPARLDFGFRLYDPMELVSTHRSIFARSLNEVVAIQFSIGHAF